MAYIDREQGKEKKIYDLETMLNNDEKESKKIEINKVNDIFNEMLNNLNKDKKEYEKRTK